VAAEGAAAPAEPEVIKKGKQETEEGCRGWREGEKPEKAEKKEKKIDFGPSATSPCGRDRN
jgi:hypothetical protein